MITLYKVYVLPHLEYCSPPLLGISRTSNEHLIELTVMDRVRLRTIEFDSQTFD